MFKKYLSCQVCWRCKMYLLSGSWNVIKWSSCPYNLARWKTRNFKLKVWVEAYKFLTMPPSFNSSFHPFSRCANKISYKQWFHWLQLQTDFYSFLMLNLLKYKNHRLSFWCFHEVRKQNAHIFCIDLKVKEILVRIQHDRHRAYPV